MALEFKEIPEWLIREYASRKDPLEKANEGLGIVNQGIAQRQAVKDKRREIDSEAFAAALESYDPENPEASMAIFSAMGGKDPAAIASLGEFKGKNVREAESRAIGDKSKQKATELIQARIDAMGKPDKPKPRNPLYVGSQGNNGVFATFEGNQPGFTTVPFPNGQAPGPRTQPTMPGSEVSKMGELENMKKKMSVLRENYSPDFVGMIDAPMQALKQKTGFGASDKAAYFKQTSQDIKDSLLRARSGAQINEQEYQRLLPIVPNETSSEVDFLAKADRFDQVLNEIISSKTQAFQKAGYNTSGFQPFNGNQPQELPQSNGMEGLSDEELYRIANGG